MNWRFETSAQAREDFKDILRFSRRNYGLEQARKYRTALEATLNDVAKGPRAPGALPRTELGPTYFSRHISLRLPRGRHLIVCRAEEDADPPSVVVLRILHDAMDIARHVETVEDDD